MNFYHLEGIFYDFLSYLTYIVSLTMVGFCFSNHYRRKMHFGIRLIPVFLCEIGSSFFAALLLCFFPEMSVFSGGIYIILSYIAVFALLFCFKQSMGRMIYALVVAIVFRNVFTRIVKIGTILFGMEDKSYSILFIQWLITIVGGLALWLVFAKKVAYDESFRPRIRDSLLIGIPIVFIIPMNYFEELLPTDFSVVFCCFTEILVSISVIFSHYVLYSEMKHRAERETERHIMEEQLKKSTAFKSVIDAMNIKVHDLKYQIRELERGGNGVEPVALRDLTSTVSDYEAFVDTGNSVVDTVLNEKYYLCLSNKIQFTAMFDGKALEFMDVADVYSLLGNLLDNAIDYVEKVAPENRFIRVSCSERVENTILLRVENYYEGKELIVDKSGLPITDKEDKFYHGFGVKSIQNVARKYGGDVVFRVEDGLFKAKVLLCRK